MTILLKRLLDVLLAGIALMAACPLLSVIAVLIFVCDGGPVLFRQIRPGYKGAGFTLLKFRTMSDARDGQGAQLPDWARLTPLGKLLRRLSLDELPQLWNVLRGDMSLVGPRPLLMQYLSRYNAEQSRRHEVKPGITGWAQIHGRNAVSWPERFALDLWYVENWSIPLDVWILICTFGQIAQQNDISHSGHATMPEFLGNQPRKS